MMKRFKLLLPLLSLVLSGCVFDHWGSSGLGDISAKYVLSNGEEKSESINIRYGEKFNITEFKVYYTTQKGKTSLLSSSEYTYSFTEGNETSFYSNRPEVDRYTVLFDYKGRTSALSFEVSKARSFIEDDVAIEVDDINYKDVTQKPRLVNCVDTDYYSWSLRAIRLGEDDEEIEAYQYPYYQNSDTNPQPMTLMPSKYKLEATFSTDHYYEVSLETTFTVNKIDFPSDKYRVEFKFEYSRYIGGYNTIGQYSTPSYPKILDRETGQENHEDFSQDAYLTWKNPDAGISTTETKTYTVIYHSPYFNDYEFDVQITLNKDYAVKPTSFLIDNYSPTGNKVNFNNQVHKVTWYAESTSGYYMVENESTTQATYPGEYHIVFRLNYPEHMVWKNTSSSEDFVYTWTIGKGEWSSFLSKYEFSINDHVLKYTQDATQNVFSLSEIVGPIVLKFTEKGASESYTYSNFTVEKGVTVYDDYIVLDETNKAITGVNPPSGPDYFDFTLTFRVTHDYFDIYCYSWIRVTL